MTSTTNNALNAEFRGARLFLQGCSGESDLWQRIVQEQGRDLDGTVFSGVLIPGVNTFDYSNPASQLRISDNKGSHALHPGGGPSNTFLETIFLSSALRDGYDAGRIKYRPLTYSSTVQYYEKGPRFTAALIQVSPPNKNGEYSLGTSADFAPSALRNTDKVYAHINPNMPFTAGPTVSHAQIAEFVEERTPLLQYPGAEISTRLQRVAARVASLVDDGDTLQFGLGKLQQAICAQLVDHRGLRVHSGMISDPILPLLDGGTVEKVVTGTAIGTNQLYARCHDERIQFAPVSHTHSPSVLGQIHPLKCINSVMQVDLLAQANSEWVAGRQVSGCGGLMDFGRGCRQHAENAFILAMPSTVKEGTLSTIVPRLPSNAGVSITRQDVDYIVTEHGIADLRYKDPAEKAQALIDIADPAFREQLAKAWRDELATTI